MAKVQNNDVVSASYRGPDRRRVGPIKFQRWTIDLVHSRWVAAFITAFVVSYCFHVLEVHNDRKIERQQQINVCVIKTVAAQQQLTPGHLVNVEIILQHCQNHQRK